MRQGLKKAMAICLAICLVSSMITTPVEAAKTKTNKATWAKRSYSVNEGRAVSLKVAKAPKNAQFKWSIPAGGKNLKLAKKSTKATASFTGIKEGTATVRCVVTAKGFKKKTLNIKVTVKKETNKATWAKKSYSVNEGGSVSLKVAKAPKNAQFKWSIPAGGKNLKLAKKSTKATASFIGIKAGTATVRCVVTAKGFKKKTLNIKVTVKAKPSNTPVPTKPPVPTSPPAPTPTPPPSYAPLNIQTSSVNVSTPYGDPDKDGKYNEVICTHKTFTFSGNNLPKHVSQMKAEYLKDPALVTALTVSALHRYTENEKDAVEILDFLAGPAGPISNYKKQHFSMQLKTRGYSYIPFSYFNGATVANDYKPSNPYNITIYETPYTDLSVYTATNKGYYEYYCKSDGVDSLTRKVQVRQAANGNYYLVEEYLLAEIKAPASSTPW